MFCTKCGGKIVDGDKFCTSCGSSAVSTTTKTQNHTSEVYQKWWMRLFKVIYIILHALLASLVLGVWSSYKPYYSSYSDVTYGSYGEAFWYSLLTLIIGMAILRLVKIGFLYITLNEKPQWKIELKKLF